ncbi:Entner-Doudoroff aldolase [Opitutaceae bacterium TAV1]|nr:Entner-Doudoroff aldolase [Opitutaceae bacterium TAV1]
MNMPSAFPSGLLREIERRGIIAVLVIDEPSDALPLIDALVAGGIAAIELTLRTPAALASLAAIRRHAPHLLVGAGTVLTPAQVVQVRDAGADFAVSPGCNPRVLAAASDAGNGAGLPFAPGIATPSDIEAALEHGCNLLKFFPAEPSGGLAYLKNMTAPYAHLGLRYIPLGGIDDRTAAGWLAEPLVAALGGSWIAPRELVRARDWTAITQRARRAMNIVRETRQGAASR